MDMRAEMLAAGRAQVGMDHEPRKTAKHSPVPFRTPQLAAYREDRKRRAFSEVPLNPSSGRVGAGAALKSLSASHGRVEEGAVVQTPPRDDAIRFDVAQPHERVMGATEVRVNQFAALSCAASCCLPGSCAGGTTCTSAEGGGGLRRASESTGHCAKAEGASWSAAVAAKQCCPCTRRRWQQRS